MLYNYRRYNDSSWFTFNPLWKLNQNVYAQARAHIRHKKDLIKKVLDFYNQNPGYPITRMSKTLGLSYQTIERILAANIHSIPWNLKHIKYIMWDRYRDELKRIKNGEMSEQEMYSLMSSIIDRNFDAKNSEDLQSFFDANSGHIVDLFLNKTHLRDTLNNWVNRKKRHGPYEEVKAPTGKDAPSSFIRNREEYEDIPDAPLSGMKPHIKERLFRNRERMDEVAQAYRSQANGGQGLSSKQVQESFNIRPGELSRIRKMYNIPARSKKEQVYEDQVREGLVGNHLYSEWLKNYEEEQKRQNYQKSMAYQRERRRTDPEYAEQVRQWNRENAQRMKDRRMQLQNVASAGNWYKIAKQRFDFTSEHYELV